MNQRIIEENNFEKARKKIRGAGGSKAGEVIFTGNDDELNRKILEKERISVLLIKLKSRRDFSKQRNSGLNSVMAKAAKKAGAKIGIFLDEIFASSGREKAEILARIRQNVKLCSKSKIEMKFIAQERKNERNIRDLKALGLVLGMPTAMTKEL